MVLTVAAEEDDPTARARPRCSSTVQYSNLYYGGNSGTVPGKDTRPDIIARHDHDVRSVIHPSTVLCVDTASTECRGRVTFHVFALPYLREYKYWCLLTGIGLL